VNYLNALEAGKSLSMGWIKPRWHSACFKHFYGMSPSIATHGGKKSHRNGSILYQLLTQGLKHPIRDTQAILWRGI
jgi:hypothetical protein